MDLYNASSHFGKIQKADSSESSQSDSTDFPHLYFGLKLEELARKSIEEMKKGDWDTAPCGVIDREIALTLDQMDRMKDLVKRQRENLLNVECAIDTELMRMEARTPRYSDVRFPEREKIQRQLQQVESERRSLMAIHERQRQDHENKLLLLMNRRAQLGK